MKFSLFLFFAMAAFLSSCNSEKEGSIATIKAMEDADTGMYSRSNMEKLVAEYQVFIEKYPEDEHVPEYMFRAGNRLSALERSSEAIDMLTRYYTKYPEEDKADAALFHLAFIYSDKLGDLQKAKETYELLIKNYPRSEYVEGSSQAIKVLGKTPEQIYEMLRSDTLKH